MARGRARAAVDAAARPSPEASDSDLGGYEAVPYDSAPISVSAPARLAALAWLKGLTPHPIDQAQVLEIGCGDGANLIPLAYHHPHAQFLGFDRSQSAIDEARHAATRLRLENLEVRTDDLRKVSLANRRFHYIIAHGVFSWIPEEAREALLRLVDEHLEPDGLLYLSYNTFPGWGVRGMIREFLFRAGFDHPDAELARGAQALTSELSSLIPGEADAYPSLIRSELARLVSWPQSYIAHEYLEVHNQAFWFSDVAALAAAHGLEYVEEAYVFRNVGFVPAGLLESLSECGLEGAQRENALDLLNYRQMRASIFSRTGADRRVRELRETLEPMWIAGGLRALSDPFHLDPDVEERFADPLGAEVGVREPLLKAALLALGRRWPNGMRLDELLEESTSVVRETDLEATLGQSAEDELIEAIFTFHRRTLLDLRMSNPRLGVSPGARPRASRLSQYEAGRRAALATPLHEIQWTKPFDRAVIALANGERDRDAIVRRLADAVLDGRLSIGGTPVTEGEMSRVESLVTPMVEQTLQTLAGWGMLEPEDEEG